MLDENKNRMYWIFADFLIFVLIAVVAQKLL